MAENSNIEWTDHTFNPWIGCTKVSDGCKNCYAEELMANRYGRVEWGPQGKRVRTSASNWKKPLAWNRKAEKLGIRYRVFCASLADVFEDKPDQPELDEWRCDLFRLIQETPNLDWLLLTKRPENAIDKITQFMSQMLLNVWIGTSVENQEQADKRIPELLKIPTKVHFLSMEPLLGPVDLELNGRNYGRDYDTWSQRIDWVIVGGESGRNARPMIPEWVRSIQIQCQEAEVPFHFKQWGEYNENEIKVGKKHAGRLLDGVEHNGYPNK